MLKPLQIAGNIEFAKTGIDLHPITKWFHHLNGGIVGGILMGSQAKLDTDGENSTENLIKSWRANALGFKSKRFSSRMLNITEIDWFFNEFRLKWLSPTVIFGKCSAGDSCFLN